MSHEIPVFDPKVEMKTLYSDGVSSLRGAFDRQSGPRLLEEYGAELQQAKDAKITKGRGPNRIWFPARPEKISMFTELITHPYITEVSEAVLGHDYQIVELGFDEPSQGAKNQPWHRDFPIPNVTKDGGRLDALAFNVTLKDVKPDMGPFEIAPGTQFMEEPEFMLARGMFVYKRYYDYFTDDTTQKRMGKLGDIQVRTPLTLHRGTTHASEETRPVMILGVCAREVQTEGVHSLPVSAEWFDGLSPRIQDTMQQHVRYTLVDTLRAIKTPGTDVEELMMGNESLIPN
ncbi:MAG TPA: phytanoyl-CoA dioxygenase family protein [Candidatus Saccharimonadales bacterium]|jgi:hypothetical protein